MNTASAHDVRPVNRPPFPNDGRDATRLHVESLRDRAADLRGTLPLITDPLATAVLSSFIEELLVKASALEATGDRDIWLSR
jgi:hypothetical protein